MTLQRQIQEARKALQDLQTDETQLLKLRDRQTAEIDALKNKNSRDFDQISTLEGKRAALNTLLDEQRQHIQTARAELDALEAQQSEQDAARIRSGKLDALRQKCAALHARKQEVDDLLTELGSLLRSHIEQINSARQAWATDLQTTREQAMQDFHLESPDTASARPGMGGKHQSEVALAWVNLFKELGEGAEAALTTSPTGRPAPGLNHPYSYRERDLWPVVHHAPRNLDFDAPVSLTIKAALAQALTATPHAYQARAEERR